MRETAREQGEVLWPPLLILGTSERVGSNWISDTLRPVLGQHNEPFRQQLAADHPLSPLNPRLANISDPDLPALSSFGRHWLVTFAASKYARTRQAVKETNLFFALPGLLALLPDTPVLILSRSPLGVASSFERSGLFRRWDYAARYRQMITMTRSGNGRADRYQPLVPDDDPPALVALTRLQVLNSVLLADALAGRDVAHIPYETAVIAPRCALDTLITVVPEFADRDLRFGRPLDADQPPSGSEDTFATTTAKTALVAHVDPASAELIRSTTAVSVAAAQAITPPKVAAQAAAWLAGDHLYQLEPLWSRPAAARPPGPSQQSRSLPTMSNGTVWRSGTCWSATPNTRGSWTPWRWPGCRTTMAAPTCWPVRCHTSAAGACTRIGPPAAGGSARDMRTTRPTG